MNIAKALKVKNRIVGQMAHNANRLNTLNSIEVRTLSLPWEDYQKKILAIREETFNVLIPKLIRLKTAIQKANAGISDKLVELQEAKGILSFWKGLPEKEGFFASNYSDNNELNEWKCAISPSEIEQEKKKVQDLINNLQDEIDAYNSVTKVEFED
jgi:hypothetical protein